MIRYFAREKNCQYIAFGMGSGNTQMELTWIGKGSQTIPPPPSRNRATPVRTHHAEPLPRDAAAPPPRPPSPRLPSTTGRRRCSPPPLLRSRFWCAPIGYMPLSLHALPLPLPILLPSNSFSSPHLHLAQPLVVAWPCQQERWPRWWRRRPMAVSQPGLESGRNGGRTG